MTEVWAEVIGQPDAVRTLSAAAEAAATIAEGKGVSQGAMTHAWLFTGPPGSGRSVAAKAFAAALQCSAPAGPRGCGHCAACRTVLAGTHADVRFIVPEGLSISVGEMRALVQIAAKQPTTGRWQVVVIEDADRLTEGASNALLKAIEEPPDRTVFLLCAPSDHPDDVSVTIRSRCRVIALRTPPADAVAEVLMRRDGITPELAQWAAGVCGGHVGRARRLANDEVARQRRAEVLKIPSALRRFNDIFGCADLLVKAAETEAATANDARNEAERQALETAMGAGGTGKGAAAASRGAKGVLKDLEKRQKSRATRTQRDTLDLALVDLAGFYRDVLVTASGAAIPLNHPDFAKDTSAAAQAWAPESALRRLEAVLACRDALNSNVKPKIAVEAMVTALFMG